MFARSAFKAMQPLKQQARRYATEGPKSGSNAALYAAGGLGVAAAGYYFLSGSPAAEKAEAKVKEAAAAVPGVEPKKALNGEWVSLLLEDVEIVNHNTKRLRFKLPEEDQVSGLSVASAVLTKYKGPEMEKAVLRPYTPVSDEDARGHLDLLVKQYPNGPMSTHMHELVPGHRLDIKGPLPKYPWAENKHKHIALIAGGTGITPMYQLARAIFNNPNDQTKVTLVFGNVTEEDILLRREFADLENKYPQRFRAFYTLDKPPSDWPGKPGQIDKNLLKTVLPEPKSEDIKIFVCGPPGLMKAISGDKVSPKDQGEITGLLKELGYSKDQVYKF